MQAGASVEGLSRETGRRWHLGGCEGSGGGWSSVQRPQRWVGRDRVLQGPRGTEFSWWGVEAGAREGNLASNTWATF